MYTKHRVLLYTHSVRVNIIILKFHHDLYNKSKYQSKQNHKQGKTKT